MYKSTSCFLANRSFLHVTRCIFRLSLYSRPLLFFRLLYFSILPAYYSPSSLDGEKSISPVSLTWPGKVLLHLLSAAYGPSRLYILRAYPSLSRPRPCRNLRSFSASRVCTYTQHAQRKNAEIAILSLPTNNDVVRRLSEKSCTRSLHRACTEIYSATRVIALRYTCLSLLSTRNLSIINLANILSW